MMTRILKSCGCAKFLEQESVKKPNKARRHDVATIALLRNWMSDSSDQLTYSPIKPSTHCCVLRSVVYLRSVVCCTGVVCCAVLVTLRGVVCCAVCYALHRFSRQAAGATLLNVPGNARPVRPESSWPQRTPTHPAPRQVRRLVECPS